MGAIDKAMARLFPGCCWTMISSVNLVASWRRRQRTGADDQPPAGSRPQRQARARSGGFELLAKRRARRLDDVYAGEHPYDGHGRKYAEQGETLVEGDKQRRALRDDV